IAAVLEIDRAPLGEGAALVVLEVTYADGGAADRYLVPMVDGREPADGDGAWVAIAAAMAHRRTLPGEAGSFVASWTGALDLEGVGAERRLRVEQSNTSVVLGDRLILKLYRHLEPGENPDLEVSAFLTDAGFGD